MRHFAMQGSGIQLTAVERFQFRQDPRIAFDQLCHAQQHPLLVRRRLPAPAPVQKGHPGRRYRIVRLLC